MHRESTPSKRTDSASRIIKAPAERIYQAFLDPKAIASWLPPKGMRAEVQAYEPRDGGAFRMTLIYEASEHPTRGKSSDHTDVVQGRFLEFLPNQRIVQLVEFDSPDPAFAGAMKMTWRLRPHGEGTEVTILCENVPEGIRKEDHDVGLNSTLENLAAFTEQSKG